MRCCVLGLIVLASSACVRVLEDNRRTPALPVEAGTARESGSGGGDGRPRDRSGELSLQDRSPRDGPAVKKDGAKPSQEAGVAVGCASWANWSCQGTLNSCTATCSGSLGANLTLTCTIAMSVSCTCKINAVQLPTCTGIPYQGNCDACEAAVVAQCCQVH